MSVINAFHRVDAPAIFARLFKSVSSTRAVEAVPAPKAFSNDPVAPRPANDFGRPHIAARRIDRDVRRANRAI